jgi:hypothetical protein
MFLYIVDDIVAHGHGKYIIYGVRVRDGYVFEFLDYV